MVAIARLSTFALAGALAVSGTVLAQEKEKKQLTPQQQRMSACAHENKGKKGDEYKQAMRDCLKSKSSAESTTSVEKPAGAKVAAPAKPSAAAAAPTNKPAAPQSAAPSAVSGTATSQKDKMKTCNAQAKEQKLKGDARKSFMSTCLKG